MTHNIHRLSTCKTPQQVVSTCVTNCVAGCNHDPSIMSMRDNSAPEVNRPGPHLDEQEYHMDNNPLYDIRINTIAEHSTMKPQHEYETVDICSTV